MTNVIYDVNMKDIPDLSVAEQELMAVLWDQPNSATSDILKGLNNKREKPITRSTLQVMIRRLIEKGWVVSEEAGRGYLYKPAQQKESSQKSLLQALKDRLFNGSRLEMVRCMFDEDISPEELEKIKSLIKEKSE